MDLIEILKALKQVKEICGTHEHCKGCAFALGLDGICFCGLTKATPEYWNLREIEEVNISLFKE